MGKAFDAILTAAGYASAVLTVLVTFLLVYEVVTRYFLHDPSVWALDFTMYTICYINFLGGAWLLREEGHVKVEILTSRLSPKSQALVTGMTSTIACLACAIFCWQAAKSAWVAYQEGQFIDGAVVVPRFLIVGIMPVGLFLLCIQFARRAWQHIRAFFSTA